MTLLGISEWFWNEGGERRSDRAFMSMIQLPRSLPMSLLVRPHRLAWPRTLPFQGSNTGSNPVGDTTLGDTPVSMPGRSCR